MSDASVHPAPIVLQIPGPAGDLDVPVSAAPGEPNRIGSAEVPMRCYEPAQPAWATLVWAHGGSFVRGTLDWPEADWVARRFADAGIRVYSVDYVLAGSEVAAPAPANDVTAALVWALDRHAGPVFVGGASAGGHLAALAALNCANRTVAPATLLLIYPTLHRQQRVDEALIALTAALPEERRFTPSRVAQMYADYLGKAAPDTAVVAGELSAKELRQLPRTIIINAERDELRASGEQFAEQLRAAGVPVEEHVEPGTVHGYLNRPAESPEAAEQCATTIARCVGALRARPGPAETPNATDPQLSTEPAVPQKIVVALPGRTLERAVGAIAGVEFVRWDLQTPPPRTHFDLVVPPYMDGPEALRALDGVTVGLVQSQSIGYDGVAETLLSGISFANAATVHESSTAELALGLTLAMQRGIPEFVRAGDESRWAPARHASLADRRILLVGFGGVSKAIEARLAGFEVTITRVARTARTMRNAAGIAVPVHGIDELAALLPLAEVVIVAVPLSPETSGLFGTKMLSRMADGALLVNVARGPVVDTDALVAELLSGRIRAALDVTDPEPLPASHPLWQCPNLFISPHVGGASTAMIPRMARLVQRQIAHLLAGEPVENLVIDRRSGAPTAT